MNCYLGVFLITDIKIEDPPEDRKWSCVLLLSWSHKRRHRHR